MGTTAKEKAKELMDKYYKGYGLTVEQSKELSIKEIESVFVNSVSEIMRIGRDNSLSNKSIVNRINVLSEQLKDFKNEIKKR